MNVSGKAEKARTFVISWHKTRFSIDPTWFILAHKYTRLKEFRDSLQTLSFGESAFIPKANLMYKIASNIAIVYL